MELIAGVSLAQRLHAEGRFSPEAALPVVKAMAAAIGAAHAAGVVHRDFKSDNVMLATGGGQGPRVVVMDFGLARGTWLSTHDSIEGRGLAGTLAYMAPEQLHGKRVGPAADIYALGVVMYEMLTGQLPFVPPPGEAGIAWALWRLSEPAPEVRSVVPDVDARWNDLVARCLEREIDRRPASADESPARAGRRGRPALPGPATCRRPGPRRLLLPRARPRHSRRRRGHPGAGGCAAGWSWVAVAAVGALVAIRDRLARARPRVGRAADRPRRRAVPRRPPQPKPAPSRAGTGRRKSGRGRRAAATARAPCACPTRRAPRSAAPPAPPTRRSAHRRDRPPPPRRRCLPSRVPGRPTRTTGSFSNEGPPGRGGAAGVWLAAPARADAQVRRRRPPPPAGAEAAADALVEQAARAYDQNRLDEALGLLARAYELSARPSILYNRAQVLRAKDDCAAALDAYSRFVAETTPDDPNRDRASRRRDEMQACVDRRKARRRRPPPRRPHRSRPPAAARPTAARR